MLWCAKTIHIDSLEISCTALCKKMVFLIFISKTIETLLLIKRVEKEYDYSEESDIEDSNNYENIK